MLLSSLSFYKNLSEMISSQMSLADIEFTVLYNLGTNTLTKKEFEIADSYRVFYRQGICRLFEKLDLQYILYVNLEKSIGLN